jgi:hypothetical protein
MVGVVAHESQKMARSLYLLFITDSTGLYPTVDGMSCEVTLAAAGIAQCPVELDQFLMKTLPEGS